MQVASSSCDDPTMSSIKMNIGGGGSTVSGDNSGPGFKILEGIPTPPVDDGVSPRRRVYDTFLNLIAIDVKVATRDEIEITVNLEIAIFNCAIMFARSHKIPRKWKSRDFTDIYLRKAASVFVNIDPNSYVGNDDILQQIRNHAIDPHAIPFMSPQELFPFRWRDEIDKKQKRDIAMYEIRPAARTDQFRCPRCRQRECDYYELQIRSADEPMTCFVTCLNPKCGHKFKR